MFWFVNTKNIIDESFQELIRVLDRNVKAEIRESLWRTSELLRKYEEFASGIELLEATRSGDYGAVRKILKQNPDSIKGVTPEARETVLHIAVRNGDLKMVEVFSEHLRGKFYYDDVVDVIDADGNTVLHLAVARKQLQTIQMLLENGPADRLVMSVNAKNRGGFRALDILDVLPESGEVDMKIEKTLRRAGALSTGEEAIRYKHETKQIEQKFDRNNQEVLIEFNESVHPPGSQPLANRNSELPIKPWLHSSVFSAIGAYIYYVTAVYPEEVVLVVFIGISIFVAAVLKSLDLHKKMLHNMQWVCTRIRLI